IMKRLAIIVAAVCAACGSAQAQNSAFGKNKVQYRTFDWQFIQTNHFDVYYAQDGYELASFSGHSAEEAYEAIRTLFRYEITNRISIVVHNSHNEFQQTNVVGEYMEEGIGGVTELFKNRIVLPFEGNYQNFRRVIHHELVHAVLNDMFYGGSIQALLASRSPLVLPLWMNEGLAEYSALRWDTNSDMFLRDATIHNYLPPIDYLGGYFAYRGGQSVWHYIATKYGEQKISEILHRLKSTRNIEQGFRGTIGLTIKELSERWQKEQKVLYWPDIAKREEPADYARRLTDHTKLQNFYNTSPAISPQGDRIAFISERDDYFDVYLMSATDGDIIRKVVSGQRTSNFEELHLLTPGITWSPDGKKIALAVKAGERDAIMIIDSETRDEVKISFDLDGIFSVDWSQDGKALAFVGQKAPQTDIYLYNLETRTLKNLTNDIFSDSDPVISPDGKTVYFCSDRKGYTDPSSLPVGFSMSKFEFSGTDLYSVSVETGVITRIGGTPWSDESSPVVSSDGKKLLYISDRNGINNVYEHDLTTGIDRPITNSLTGIYQLSLSHDGSKMAFSSLTEAGFDVFVMRVPFERSLSVQELEPTEFIKRLRDLPRTEKPVVTLTSTEQSSDTVAVRGDVIVIADSAQAGIEHDKQSGRDLRGFVFSEEVMQDTSSGRRADPALFDVADNVDVDGNFVPRKYKLNFTPDLVYGTAGYSTFYGVEGSTLMAFSDMLGDHQIIFQTNLLLDLRNSDYGLVYYYLPERIDFGFQGFHSARFLYITNRFGVPTLYRFRQWALGAMASYPIDRFRRLDLSVMWLNLSRDNLDDARERSQRRSFVLPLLSYVRDNSIWKGGWFGPNNGMRFNATLYGSAKFGSSSLDLQTFTLDYRSYSPLFKDFIFVFRGTAGLSNGKDRQNFFIGGNEGWINRRFDGNTFPIINVEDYAFLTPVLPLRGFNYNAQTGTRYALVNLEARFPLIRYLIGGSILPLGFQNILGAAFLDVGSAWSHTGQWQTFRRTPSGSLRTKDLLIGMGIGTRLFFFGFPIRFDIAWNYDWAELSRPVYYVSIGPEI
ncbi:MAG: PD40 domain-containing protein, partial [Ignavibacteriales bacterium]|nr:PD40 domain-containing protein [Ignavibacteriales bacterium]